MSKVSSMTYSQNAALDSADGKQALLVRALRAPARFTATRFRGRSRAALGAFDMAYRNKTFASENIHAYRLMQVWRKTEGIDFNFYDAHDLNVVRDTSSPETIKSRLRKRLNNAKQVVMLIGDISRRKAARPSSFFHYEVRVIDELNLPIVFVNLNGSRRSQKHRFLSRLQERYTISTSFQPLIIKYALDEYPPKFASSRQKRTAGPHYYKAFVYQGLGLRR